MKVRVSQVDIYGGKLNLLPRYISILLPAMSFKRGPTEAKLEKFVLHIFHVVVTVKPRLKEMMLRGDLDTFTGTVLGVEFSEEATLCLALHLTFPEDGVSPDDAESPALPPTGGP